MEKQKISILSKIINKIKASRYNPIKKMLDYKRYIYDKKIYNKNNVRINFATNKKTDWPILGEWNGQAGNLGTYFWQDLWAAKHIHNRNPIKHYDIGSRIDGFIGHLCAYRKNIVLIDVRPFEHSIEGLGFIQADAKDLSNISNDSIESLSSLCAIEHFGLGRYGDEIDPEGCFKALKEIQRVIMPGGYFYLSVPIGKECVEFNAQRTFYASTIVKELVKMELIDFSTINAYEDEIRYNDDIHRYDNVSTLGGTVFGLFCFKKI